MSTVSPAALSGIYKAIEKSPQYSSMRRGGIVGDLAHRRRGGYHISRQDQSSSNYSVQAPADRRGRSDVAAGIDITMGPSDMKLMTRRLMNACKANHADPSAEPRVEPVREFFGTLDGRKVTGWNRYPSSNRRVGYTTSDSSHLWHVHISIFRDYADDAAKMRGVIDILLGVPLKPPPKPPAPKPPTPTPEPEDEDMPLSDADINKIRDAVLDAKIGTGAVQGWTLRHLIDWTARATDSQGDVLAELDEPDEPEPEPEPEPAEPQP